ncbi:MAG: fibronectin type III domain-containing protein, partial [Candidatus Eisenbacteria bacterium]
MASTFACKKEPSGPNVSADTRPPDPIGDLTVGAVTATSVALSWTAPGDDGAEGTAAGYDLRYAEAEASLDDWTAATLASGEPTPGVAGTLEHFVVGGLRPATHYFFGIRTTDEAGNVSATSDPLVEATTAADPGAVVWREVYRTPSAVNALWGSSADNVYAVAGRGGVYRFDGNTWSALSTGANDQLSSIWGSGPDDVFIVGGFDAVHFNGTRWGSPGQIPLPFVHLTSVWGSAPDDVFVAGSNGGIARFDGTHWTSMSQGSVPDLRAIWGFGPSDIYAVGQCCSDGRGVVLHYDGTTWSTSFDGSAQDFFGVWGSAPDDVYVVGRSGAAFHFDGQSWSRLTLDAGGQILKGVWGRSRDDVYVVGSGDLLL